MRGPSVLKNPCTVGLRRAFFRFFFRFFFPRHILCGNGLTPPDPLPPRTMTATTVFRYGRAARAGHVARADIPAQGPRLERHARAGVRRQRGVAVRVGQLSRGEDRRAAGTAGQTCGRGAAQQLRRRRSDDRQRGTSRFTLVMGKTEPFTLSNTYR